MIRLSYGYPNLYEASGYPLGVQRAPHGYEHPWLVVFEEGTVGAWSRREAREIWKEGHFFFTLVER